MHVAVIGGNQPGHAVKAGGLTGAVGAEQTDGLAAFDIKRNIAQYRPVFIFLADIKNFEFGLAVTICIFHYFLLFSAEDFSLKTPETRLPLVFETSLLMPVFKSVSALSPYSSLPSWVILTLSYR